jgi:hypothetical protein
MKISGYSDEGLPIEQIVHSELAEITLSATPGELRRMAEFFAYCASEMDRMGTTYDHLHLSDRMKEFRESPHLVLVRSDER